MGHFDRNKLTNEILSTIVPRMALIAYQGEGAINNDYYLEARPIGKDGAMGAGMPVTYKFMQEIAENYTGKQEGVPFGAIPPTMLYADTRKGCEKYIWHNPPQKRTMYFKPDLGLENVEYHIPGVVYAVKRGHLSIYAYKDKTPTPETELFIGPFFNTTNGSVCLGSANLKKPTNPAFAELIAYWEKRFWMTEFSHLGGGSNPTKDNLVVVTKTAVGKPFDLKQLIPASLKLKDLMK